MTIPPNKFLMSGKKLLLSIMPTYVIAMMYAGIARGISKSHEISLRNGKSYTEVNHAVTVPITKDKNPTPTASDNEFTK